MKNLVLFILFLVIFVTALTVYAAVEYRAKGQVISVDQKSKTLNISHEAIRSMGMPAMTMDFRVADPAILNDVEPGQKIDFVITTDKRGRFVVLDLE